jgi:hypothetical protein
VDCEVRALRFRKLSREIRSEMKEDVDADRDRVSLQYQLSPIHSARRGKDTHRTLLIRADVVTGKVMEILAQSYAPEDAREQFRLSGFGHADRRIHLPVHVPDLVAHEAATNRDGELIRTMRPHLSFADIGGEEIDDAFGQLRGLVAHSKRDKHRRKNVKNRARRADQG